MRRNPHSRQVLEMGVLFDLIRASVTARQVADMYGLSVNRHEKALCPWHNDRHPSLSFDRRTGRCKCFSCNAGGGAVDLAAVLLNLSPLEAAKQIAADFDIQCDDLTDRRPIAHIGESPAQIRKRVQTEEARIFSELCKNERQLRAVLDKYTAETAENAPEFWEALKKLSDVQTRLDNMM